MLCYVWDIQHRKVKFLFQKCDNNILLLTRLVVGSFLKVLLLYLLSMFTCLSCGLMTSDTTLTEAPGGWRLTGEDRTVNTWSGPLTQEEATSLSRDQAPILHNTNNSISDLKRLSRIRILNDCHKLSVISWWFHCGGPKLCNPSTINKMVKQTYLLWTICIQFPCNMEYGTWY